jgi:HlyD family secretion protein
VVTYDARLDVDNGELLLRPGMTATVAVVTRQADGVLTVPNAAFRFSPPAQTARQGFNLQRLFMGGPPRLGRPGDRRSQGGGDTEGGRTLHVLRDGAPQPVVAKTGATDGEYTEILSGLQDGDAVVISAREAGGR